MKCEQVNHAGGGHPGSKRSAYPHEAQFTEEREELPMKNGLPIEEALSLNASLQIKSAEYWLKLSEADQALKELENLPSRIWTHRLALKTLITAMGALRERGEMTVQA